MCLAALLFCTCIIPCIILLRFLCVQFSQKTTRVSGVAMAGMERVEAE